MVFLYNEDGEVIGKFDETKAVCIATSGTIREPGWQCIMMTRKGSYILQSEFQDGTSHDLLSKNEAIEFMEKWGYSEKKIKEKFPDYVPEETI